MADTHAPRARGAWTVPVLRAAGTIVLLLALIPVVSSSFNLNGLGVLIVVAYAAGAFVFFALCHAVAAIVEHTIEIRRRRELDRTDDRLA